MEIQGVRDRVRRTLRGPTVFGPEVRRLWWPKREERVRCLRRTSQDAPLARGGGPVQG
ncbi:protein of unknown function [Methylacidimicrobium sp. AP8]|nr:protein of unknown function [Methylacidimicrobium sp. AP8]